MDADEVAPAARARAALRTAAVTGTNGKTTTTSMIASIVEAAGEPSARVTTLGAWVNGRRLQADATSEEFHLTVEAAAREGVRTLALEVTSKALAGGFARRWPAEIAVLTNLTRDHLDMHGSAEAYLAAKAQLFLALKPGGVAVLNADDSSSALVADLVPAGASIRWFSVREARHDLAATEVRATREGIEVTLAPSPLATRLGGSLSLGILGDVHAENALAAALASDALGYSAAAIRDGLRRFGGVPGRFQVVARRPLIVVDYAHTPDGLQGTLRTARKLVGAGGRLLCVFGCGGERDIGKRPEMGAIAHRLADLVLLTSDNPRRESPEAIASDIVAGVEGSGARWILDLERRSAITRAIAEARPDDLVVIAGKGHEEVQEIGGNRLPFSDLDVAREVCGKAGIAVG